MYTITFTFEQNTLVPITLKNVESGQTLLELALTHKIALGHDCGGMCICASCHLYVTKGIEFVEEIYRKEADFIQQVPDRNSTSRLSCQCLLLDNTGEITVIVPNNNHLP